MIFIEFLIAFLPILTGSIEVLPWHNRDTFQFMAKVQSNAPWNLGKISSKNDSNLLNYFHVQGTEDVDVYLLAYGVHQNSTYFNHPISELNDPFLNIGKKIYTNKTNDEEFSLYNQRTAIAGKNKNNHLYEHHSFIQV